LDYDELRDLEGFSFDPRFSEVGLDEMEVHPSEAGAAGVRPGPVASQHPWAQALMAHPLVEADETAAAVRNPAPQSPATSPAAPTAALTTDGLHPAPLAPRSLPARS
jgi:hypothetical protein